MDEQWLSAPMRIVCLIEHDGATSQDECVHIFRADGWDGALRFKTQFHLEEHQPGQTGI